MNKIIAFILFIAGGCLWYFLHNVWDMSSISWIVAIIVIFFAGKLASKKD